MHSVALDVAAALATPRSCPACGAAELRATSDGTTVVLACVACARRWLPELGILVPAGEPAGKDRRAGREGPAEP